MIQPPDYAVLIDEMRCTGIPMRYVGRKDFVQSTVVDTGNEHRMSAGVAVVFDQTLQMALNEAMMFVAPFIQLMTPITADYAGQLLIARLTVVIDGEEVIDNELLERYLVAPPCRIEDRQRAGEPLVYIGREEDALLGCCRLHFLPNASRIQFILKDIPSGAGAIRFVSGAVVGHYATRHKGSGLFGVGLLDDDGNTVKSIARQWPETQARSGQLTQDKIERAHGDALRRALAEKKEEIRRLRDATEKELRVRTEEKERELRRLEEEAELREKAERKLELIQRLKEDSALHAKAEVRPTPALEEKPEIPPHSIDLDETLTRVRRRLFRWGAVAMTILFVSAAIALFLLKALFMK